jgi:hypothetical protein
MPICADFRFQKVPFSNMIKYIIVLEEGMNNGLDSA